MNIDNCTPEEVHTLGDGEQSPCTGLAPDVLPETQGSVSAKSSQTGVSTRNALSPTALPKQKETPHWYVLRCTYGREKAAYEYLVAKGITAFYPTVTTMRLVNGKRKSVTESRLPNIFFAFGTEEQLKTFVYDNVNLPHLRFYYRHFHINTKIMKAPQTVPDRQMESLKTICAADATDIIISPGEVEKFKKGQLVQITDGAFKGVTGRVARWQGQQRVGVIVEGLMTVVTAYIPKAFITPFEHKQQV